MPEIIIDARKAAISETLEVRRILPFRRKRMVGPFILWTMLVPYLSSPLK